MIISILYLVSKVNKASILQAMLTSPPEEVDDASEAYHMSKRDPISANAQRSCLWEVACLTRHPNPVVRRVAETFRDNQKLQLEDDPLEDFTVFRFLDKLVSKNRPKKRKLGDL